MPHAAMSSGGQGVGPGSRPAEGADRRDEPSTRRTVCVDLNGVLDTYPGWQGYVSWHPPREGAADFLRSLNREGFKVVILTVRDPVDARRWLETHGLSAQVAEVTNRKPPAVAYVDDRALCFQGDFESTLEDLLTFEPFWRGETESTPRPADTREVGEPPSTGGGAGPIIPPIRGADPTSGSRPSVEP